MKHTELRRKFFDFFSSKNHKRIPSSVLVPRDDPTTLFTGSGMQPLVPYLLGEKHPLGKRLVDIQKCLRAEDMDEVGSTPIHDTFFEMMGNWSLGDYFKKEQLDLAMEFFVKEIGLDVGKVYVTVFEGEGNISKDEESIEIWKSVFKKYDIEAEEGDRHLVGKGNFRIFPYPRAENWWERSGAKVGDPAGPSSEMFYDTGRPHNKKYGDLCHVNCDCKKYVEICNNVLMEYVKKEGGIYEPLKEKNIDMGSGLERVLMVANEKASIFETDVFALIIEGAEKMTTLKYGADAESDRAFQILADHMRASVFLVSDGVLPGNKEQGYVLRRLIRRCVRFARKLDLKKGFTKNLTDAVAKIFEEVYPELLQNKEEIGRVLFEEEEKFYDTLERGLKELEHILAFKGTLSGKDAFLLYESYGFPVELSLEIASEKNAVPDLAAVTSEYEEELKKHKELSEQASTAKGTFKGGLEGTSDSHIRYHTSTHLLHQALRDVLGDAVTQKGSNITTERLRFDFSFDRKLTDEEVKTVEEIVNQKIKEELPVSYVELPLEEAKESGALHFFNEKYPDTVKVYFVGESLGNAYSKEFCGGPHISNTSELGTFKITKEEAVSAGVRRVKAVLI